jgi:hypothetical protein
VALATPENGSLSVGTYASANAYNENPEDTYYPPDLQSEVLTWGDLATPAPTVPPGSPLSASVSSYQSVTNFNGTGFSSASMSDTATWAPDGDSGTITFDYTLASNWPGDIRGGAATPVEGPSLSDWSYTFIADATGDLVLNYDITVSGQPFGLQGFYTGGIFPYPNVPFPSGDGAVSGAVDYAVTAGNTYSFFLGQQSNYDGAGGLNNLNGSVQADISWTLPGGSVPAAPDNGATIAMLGFVCVGLLASRRWTDISAQRRSESRMRFREAEACRH